jgi:hypothetical protein
MSFFTYLVLFVLVLFAAEWVYRVFFRQIDQPTNQLIALAEHFKNVGLSGHIYPIRHGYKHSRLTACAGFEIKQFPFPVVINHYTPEAIAGFNIATEKNNRNLKQIYQNGTLFMDLSMWGGDIEAMAARVITAFESFVHS